MHFCCTYVHKRALFRRLNVWIRLGAESNHSAGEARQVGHCRRDALRLQLADVCQPARRDSKENTLLHSLLSLKSYVMERGRGDFRDSKPDSIRVFEYKMQ